MNENMKELKEMLEKVAKENPEKTAEYLAKQLNLKPMICDKCQTINPMQEMINTIQCLQKGCGGTMFHIEK